MEESGERDRIRTCDPLIKSQLLYQLSYAPYDFMKLFDNDIRIKFYVKKKDFFYVFLSFIATLTFAGTNEEISPPKRAISFTNLDATN